MSDIWIFREAALDQGDVLIVPSASEEEARSPPVIGSLARTIAALAGRNGVLSPGRLTEALDAAKDLGLKLENATLLQVLVQRHLASPPQPDAAFAELKLTSDALSTAVRVDIKDKLLNLVAPDSDDASVLRSKMAEALNVQLRPDQKVESAGFIESVQSVAGRAFRQLFPEDEIIRELRQISKDQDLSAMISTIQSSSSDTNFEAIKAIMPIAIATLRNSIENVRLATNAHQDALVTAKELEDFSEKAKKVANQRYAAMTRRAKLLVRHLREDLHALVEDAVEEFENDLRRVSVNTGWFGRIDTTDFTERTVIKNLERRYTNLSRRYQDQLDLLAREVAEYRDEFTDICDEALVSMARHEFRNITPNPRLEIRVKAAIDRASSRTIMSGTVGAVATGAAVQSGALGTAALAAFAVHPAGMVFLGALGLAATWKLFAKPSDRKKLDIQMRSRDLAENLRERVLSNLANFEAAVQGITGRFSDAATSDIKEPSVEAERIREIASSYETISRGVMELANTRLDRLVNLAHAISARPSKP